MIKATTLEDFFKDMDWGKVRIKRFPKRIFLCGQAQCPTSIRYLLQGTPLPEDQYVIAENAMSWTDAKAFASDLLELEEYFASVARIIVIVSESPGSFAEMGAFTSNKKIQKKILIVTQEKHYKSNSFIRYGIIQHLQGEKTDPTYQICVIPTIDPFTTEELAKYKTEICNLVSQAIQDFPTKTAKFNKKSITSQVLLIRDAIQISYTIEKNRLLRIICNILHRKIESFEPTFLKIIFVLEKFNLIKKHFKGSQVFYTSLEDELCLRYPVKAGSAVELQRYLKEKIFKQDKEMAIEVRNTICHVRQNFLFKTLAPKIEAKVPPCLPMMYKVFKIPKKNGGQREIAQPTSLLKNLQRQALKELLNLPIHSSAKAYIKGTNGILSNIQSHVYNKYFLKLDFEDFFHSINAETLNVVLSKKAIPLSKRLQYLKIFLMFDKNKNKTKTREVYKLLKNSNISDEELLKIITEKYRTEFRLSIGAPSSPYISNIVMYEFDTLINDWCQERGISYSRYADDLTFSSNEKKYLKNVLSQVKKILKDINYLFLKVNKKKTKKVSLSQRVTITGLNVTPEHKISIGRKQKKIIRSLLHHLSLKTLPPDKYNYLRGWISYIKNIEPQHFKSLVEKYDKDINSLYNKRI